MSQENPVTFDESRGPLGPGSLLGPYRILSLLGAGGMGQIYRAFDARLGREVAIKVAEEHFSERFDREVRAVAALNHPNIRTIHDVGANYLVMELVDGDTLRVVVERGLTVDRTLTIAQQMLQALCAAHRAGLATGEDDAQAASAGSSVAAVPRRIIEEDKLDRREQLIPVVRGGSHPPLAILRQRNEHHSVPPRAPRQPRDGATRIFLKVSIWAK